MSTTTETPLRVLVWHVHGSWMEAFVRGRHQYLVPALPGGGAWGRGFAGRDWHGSCREVSRDELGSTPVDVVVLQRPEERELAARWLGRTPGRDVPAIYVEHNTPPDTAAGSVHPMADNPDIPLVHVTHFNDLMWDSGDHPTTVIRHGIPDPGDRYTGDLPRATTLINEPVRRWRITGTDLLPTLSGDVPVDVFGIGVPGLETHFRPEEGIRGVGDLPHHQLHAEMARRRVYLHTARWTSLGLSLLEAMQLGMPVVAFATTEVATTVPPEAGVVSTDVRRLAAAVRRYREDPVLAATTGKHAREHALAEHGLQRFLDEWDSLLAATAGGGDHDRR